jgi:hypothetical protein
MSTRMAVKSTLAPEVILGAISACQGCGAPGLETVVDLGHHPPCDSLLTREGLSAEEATYPVVMCRCSACGLAQLNFAVEPEILFFREYPYRTALTRLLRDHFRSLTDEITDRLSLGNDDLAVDLGSNDGTLLKGFQQRGVAVLGIEPTGIADIAVAEGVPTINEFLTEDVVSRIVEQHGTAAVVTGANMFAHINNLYPSLRAVSELVGDEGVFVSESHYLLNLVEELQYDTVYHEHLRFYSLRPLMEILRRAGFSVFDAQRVPTHGGSIRVWADKGRREPTSRVSELLELEEERGLYEATTYERFRERVVASKHALLRLVLDARARGRVVGIGAPGRASTVLNFCGLGPDLVEATVELPGSLKIGKYTPGTHVPIIEESNLFADPPQTALVLSWHIGDEIIPKLRENGFRGDFIVPLPEPRLLPGS